MTVNQITTAIAGVLERQDDFTFKRSLLFRINSWRSTLIKQALDKTPSDRKFFTQSLCIDMKKYTNVCDVDICQAMSRSVREIPVILRAGSTVFDFLGSVDGYTAFGQFTMGTERYLRSKYNHLPRYDFRGPRIYVTNDRIKKILAIAIWDDPEVAFMFNCTEGNCDFWNSEYPAPYETCQRIIQSMMAVDARRLLPHENKEVEVNEQVV